MKHGLGVKEGTKNKRMMLFSGSSATELSEKIADGLDIELGKVSRTHFKNGEIYVKFDDSVRGADVFIIQTCSEPVNEHIMELLVMIDALKRASAAVINAVIPHYGYARQDKKSEGREPITAKLLADLLSVAGMDRAILVDLHSATIQGFFDVPVDHVTAIPILSKYFKDKGIEDGVVVSPDVGGVRRAAIFARRLNFPLAILDKRRPAPNLAEIENIVGDVSGKEVIIIDDMIDTGGTLINAIDMLKRHKAKKVYIGATHPLFSGDAINKMQSSGVDEIVVLDTMPIKKKYDQNIIKVLSIAPLLAKTIKKVYYCKSVSELFKGENLV